MRELYVQINESLKQFGLLFFFFVCVCFEVVRGAYSTICDGGCVVRRPFFSLILALVSFCVCVMLSKHFSRILALILLLLLLSFSLH